MFSVASCVAGVILCSNGFLSCSLMKTRSDFIKVVFIWEWNIDLASDNLYSVCSPMNTGTFCSVFTCAGNRGTLYSVFVFPGNPSTLYGVFVCPLNKDFVWLFQKQGYIMNCLFACTRNRGTFYIVPVCLPAHETDEFYIVFVRRRNRGTFYIVFVYPRNTGKIWPRNNTIFSNNSNIYINKYKLCHFDNF